MSERQEAPDWAVEYLQDRYPAAKAQEVSGSALGSAFPKGVIPNFSTNGILRSVGVVPDSDTHILKRLDEAHSSQSAFDDVLAWASVKLLRLKFQVQHPRPEGHRMLRWTDDTSTSVVRNVA
jgi:hypothetical protein